MDDVEESIEMLSELTSLGLHVTIDDFGVGYSSLSHLRRFPVSGLKIDCSFVRGMVDNSDDAAIVAATIALGHSLRLNVVAEGVENVKQRNSLRTLKCDECQGYLYSKPLAPELIKDWLHRHQAEKAAQTADS